LRISSLVISFLPYRTADEDIFMLYKNFYEYTQNHILTKAEIEVLYVLYLYQMLINLGYIKKENTFILPNPNALVTLDIAGIKKICTQAIESNSLEFVI
jgi:recombinational DNA repair protein (RecF pathway)